MKCKGNFAKGSRNNVITRINFWKDLGRQIVLQGLAKQDCVKLATLNHQNYLAVFGKFKKAVVI